MRALNDDALARDARDGDPRALAELYRRHAPGLLAFLRRVTRDRAEAEDVLSETFLKLLEGRGSYDGRGKFRSWLTTVAVHRAFDRRRNERRRHELSPYVRSAPVSDRAPSDPLRDAEARELAARVESALEDLPPPAAAAFFLRVHEGWTYPEIAAATGEPEGTLRSRVHHALKQVRRIVLGEGAPARASSNKEPEA